MTKPSSRCRCTEPGTSRSARRPATSTSDLPDGCTDEPYLQALDEALASAWTRQAAHPPGLAFYLAGADPHENDRLGRLKISSSGLLERDRRVLAWLRERGIPVALSMAGGYGRDLATTVEVQRATLAEAFSAWQRWPRRSEMEQSTA